MGGALGAAVFEAEDGLAGIDLRVPSANDAVSAAAERDGAAKARPTRSCRDVAARRARSRPAVALEPDGIAQEAARCSHAPVEPFAGSSH